MNVNLPSAGASPNFNFEMNQLCKVCGEPAAGFHFGAFTCEGCKSFFGRTYNNLSSLNECKNNGRCVINKKNRTSCKACRLRKCLMVGMSKSGSRYGRRSNWFKIHCLMQEHSHQMDGAQGMLNGNGFNGFSAGLSPIKSSDSAEQAEPTAAKCSSPPSESSNPAKSPSSDTSDSKPPLGRFHPYGGALPPQLFYDKAFLSPLATSLPFSPFAPLQAPYPLFQAAAYQQKLLFPQSYLPAQLSELYQKKAAMAQASPPKMASPTAAADAPEQDSPIDLSTRGLTELAARPDSDSDSESVHSAAASSAGSLSSEESTSMARPAAVETPLDLTART